MPPQLIDFEATWNFECNEILLHRVIILKVALELHSYFLFLSLLKYQLQTETCSVDSVGSVVPEQLIITGSDTIYDQFEVLNHLS